MAEVQAVSADVSFSANFKCGKTDAPVKLFEDRICIGNGDAKKIFFQDVLKAEVKEKKVDGHVILKLIYIDRRKPTDRLLRKADLLLEGSESDCTSLHEKLEHGVQKVPGRPQSLLVLINPKSGGSSGEKIYQKQVAPFFELAGIKTVVRVTERSGHMTELLKNETISSYDGIVVVGGDGTLHECLNGLISIMQKEAGFNIDDPACDLVQTSVTIGVISAGTGNGIADGATGTDIKTCALSIIRGNKRPLNVASIHSNNKLLSYSCLLSGHGFFSDMIHSTETKRWMGRGRYPVVLLGSLFSKPRVFGAEVEYLPVEYEKKPEFKFELEATDGQEVGWKKVKEQLTGVFNFNMEVTEPNQDIRSANSVNGVSLFLENSYSRLSHSRWLKKMLQRTTDFDQLPGLSKVNIKEFKVKLDCEFSSEGEIGAQNNVPPLEQTLNIDGEIYGLPCPSFHFKFHKKTVQLFVLDT